MTSTTTLIDLGGGRTELTIVQAYAPETIASPEFEAGFTTSLDCPEAHLTSFT